MSIYQIYHAAVSAAAALEADDFGGRAYDRWQEANDAMLAALRAHHDCEHDWHGSRCTLCGAVQVDAQPDDDDIDW